MNQECPTPFKLRFASKREARAASSNIEGRNSVPRRGKKRVAKAAPLIYQCPCGGYHLTRRRPDHKTRAKVSVGDSWSEEG